MLNQTFNCSSPISCEFELSEVYAHVMQDDPRATRPPFSLIFKAPSSISPEQGIYQLSHDEMGAFAVFLVPVEQIKGSLLFEAAFT